MAGFYCCFVILPLSAGPLFGGSRRSDSRTADKHQKYAQRYTAAVARAGNRAFAAAFAFAFKAAFAAAFTFAFTGGG